MVDLIAISAFSSIRLFSVRLKLLQKSHEQTVRSIGLCRRCISNEKQDDHVMCEEEDEKVDVLGVFMEFVDCMCCGGGSLARTGRLGGTVSVLYRLLTKSGPLVLDSVRIGEIYDGSYLLPSTN